MARLEITGIDGLLGDLTRAGSRLRPMIEEALRQSGEALAEEVLAQEERFKAPTGKLGESIADGAESAGCPKIRRCANQAAAQVALAEEVRPGATILVKASRGMKFEELVEFVKRLTESE